MRSLSAFADLASASVRGSAAEYSSGFISIVIRVLVAGQLWTVLLQERGHSEQIELRTVLVLNVLIASAQTPWEFTSLPERVRSGEVVADLLSPASLTVRGLGLQAGTFIAQLPRVAVGFTVACAVGFITIPWSPQSVLVGILAICFGSAIAFVLQFLVGLSSFWVTDSEPAMMAYRAVSSLLTGAVVPIALFPGLMSEIVAFLPFGLQANLGSTALANGSVVGVLPMLGVQLVWFACLLGLVVFVERLALKRLTSFGG
jgi:ABC-2 type transport system permease protein